MLDADLQRLKRNRAAIMFNEALRSNTIWLLSFVDSDGDYKSDVLAWLASNQCQNIPHAIFSLDLYAEDIGNLLSALLESPTIRNLIPDHIINNYETQTKSAFEALSRVDTTIKPSQQMDGSPYASQHIEADMDEIVRSAEHHSDVRIANIWLSTIESLEGQERVVFLFDNIDVLRQQNQFFLWSIMERAHMKIKGFLVVVTSCDEITLPSSWDYAGNAQACYL